MKPWSLLFTLFPLVAIGQTTSHQKLVDSLKLVTDMPYICETENSPGCGDKIFWRVVQQKQAIIPLLIDKLSDPTTTSAVVPNFGGQWTVGDIAYSALQEIIQGIPTFELLGVKFDQVGCGYCFYWDHLRKSRQNRIRFKAAVRSWYNRNKQNLIWVTSNDFITCDCRGQHPNGGHFAFKK
jgi:hypothetical protein